MCNAHIVGSVLRRTLLLLIIHTVSTLCVAEANSTVLYSFGAFPSDGVGPTGGLLFDKAGNLYGTTIAGGTNCPDIGGCGIVFKLSPSQDGWAETILYNFCQDYPKCTDGSSPFAGLVADGAGNFYGTTSTGGSGFGIVFELSPPAAPTGIWKQTVIWTFQGPQKGDGAGPSDGKLNWDAAGSLYGTTGGGGPHNRGTVFELTPQQGGGWTETILHSFNGSDGTAPAFGIAFDKVGNFYGTTQGGGITNSNCSEGCGVVYKMSQSNGQWTEEVLHKFDYTNGSHPYSPISIDAAGNLYGTFQDGGLQGGGFCPFGTCGGVFQLEPNPGGGWAKRVFFFDGHNGGNPRSGVLVDGKTGILFGTTWGDSNVYMIRNHKETVLYTFCSMPNCADGRNPSGGLLVFHDKKLYGATPQGGAHNNSGVVFSLSR